MTAWLKLKRAWCKRIESPYDLMSPLNQGGDTPYTKARRFLSTCERGHLGRYLGCY